eukprot:3177788-Heterocapsa_arctica.AAC.1
MEQTKSNIGTNQCGYIVFEDFNNKEYASKLDEKVKVAEIGRPKLNIKGDIVDEIMAMGFNLQNACTKYTGKFCTKQAKLCIGSQSKA